MHFILERICNRFTTGSCSVEVHFLSRYISLRTFQFMMVPVMKRVRFLEFFFFSQQHLPQTITERKFFFFLLSPALSPARAYVGGGGWIIEQLAAMQGVKLWDLDWRS